MILVSFVMTPPVSRNDAKQLNGKLEHQGLQMFVNNEGTMLMVPHEEKDIVVVGEDLKAVALTKIGELAVINVNPASATILVLPGKNSALSLTMGKQYKASMGVVT